tara:strand:- start:3091 stop:4542 length:1452 start_codon:yes stop_codon:yes gene_type:complete
MAQSNIDQNPYNSQTSGILLTPVEQELVFVVENDDAVANEIKTKFGVEVHIGNDSLNPSTTTDQIGIFKASPNNQGVGIFNFQDIVNNYVRSNNLATKNSKYKTITQGGATINSKIPIHLIDKLSANTHAIKYFMCQFFVEFLNTTTNQVERAPNTNRNSDQYMLINSYVKHNDPLIFNGADFGFDMDDFIPLGTAANKRFLTNAPTTQYANDGDYGTLAFLTPSLLAAENTKKINITYYNSSDVAYAGVDTYSRQVTSPSTGGYNTWSSLAERQMLYLGCFPANLKNWSTNYATAYASDLAYYKIQIKNSLNTTQALQTITIYVNCPETKNFEPIRLCWLNQWGAWDYYTFTKKSIRSTSTKGTTYTQLGGTWNGSYYKPDAFRGGVRSFKVNATEKITMNSDFVNEDHNVMFEELTNSPEVYLLEGYQTDSAPYPRINFNQYVTPVKLTSSSFTRKTKANDNLIQYTFEIEKSKTLRTQSI